MPRYEITGGNGRGAAVSEIVAAVKASGGRRVGTRHAFGWSNQPRVCSFTADDARHADSICKSACVLLWPGDESIMANLIAYEC